MNVMLEISQCRDVDKHKSYNRRLQSHNPATRRTSTRHQMSTLHQTAFRLQRYFSIASGILMLAVIVPLAYTYYRSEVNEHTALAGVRNASLAQTFANTLWPVYGAFLLRDDLSAAARQSHGATNAMDLRIREMFKGLQVTKIKVYNLNGVAIYSSVIREIGESKGKNPGFLEARAGQVSSELTHRGTMSATEGMIQNVDVVSTYIPIRNVPDGPVVAVFELYSNVTESVARIQTIAIRLLLTLAVVFLVLYLSLLKIVARADGIMQRQYVDLKDNEARLQSKTLQLQREIQDRLEVEQALRQSEKLAASASKAKSEFLSFMSHELRTPMNALLGFTQLLESEPGAPLNENQRQFTRQIMSAGEHLQGLIEQALDLSRIEAGKLSLVLEPVNVPALVRDTLPLVQHMLTQHQVSPVRLELDDMQVIADRGRFKQLILNLLSNAIKYNKPHGSIHIRTALEDKQLRISVMDSGQGIHQDRMSELFQPYSRLGMESENVEGTGIGLAFSKRLVEAMGGAIGAESEHGIGSTFWITLPLAKEADSHAPDTGLETTVPPDDVPLLTTDDRGHPPA